MNRVWHFRSLTLDPILLAAVIGLLVLGIVMVSSASISLADKDMGQPLYFLYRHLGAIAIGCCAALVAFVIPTEVWFRMNWFLLFFALLLLGAVLIPSLAPKINNSTRWLHLGPITFQASEIARLFLLLYISGYVIRHHEELTTTLLGFIKPMLVVGLASALLMREPDFGATVMLTLVSLGILFFGGARLRDFFAIAVLASFLLIVFVFLSEYRMERITAFLDPWADVGDSGYQLAQSLIAVGRGDLFGVGLGGSVQKLFYLPEAHTDFVFAVLSEELGLVGATAVIALLSLVVYRALSLGPKAARCGLPFHGLVTVGLGITLGVQAFINIGVNIGLLPTKGLTLPLLSYGRTSMVVTLMSLGLLARIQHEVNEATRHRKTRRSGRIKV